MSNSDPAVKKEFPPDFDDLKLYEIEHEIASTLQSCIDADGEITTDAEARLDALSIVRERKVLAYACVFKSLKAQMDTIELVEKRFAERRANIGRRRDWLKRQIERAMIPGERMKNHLASIHWGQTAPFVRIVDEKRLQHYEREQIVTVLDRDLLKKDLEEGKPVAGAELARTSYVVIR